MKEFDWDFAEKTRNKNVIAWLKENHAQSVREERFINEVALIKRTDRQRGLYKHLNHAQYSKKVKPGSLKKEYAYLIKTFGFFV